jgi:hypothetical protein
MIAIHHGPSVLPLSADDGSIIRREHRSSSRPRRWEELLARTAACLVGRRVVYFEAQCGPLPTVAGFRTASQLTTGLQVYDIASRNL